MSRTKRISVLLADDHLLLLDLLEQILSRDDRFMVSGKAPTGTLAVDLARSKKPDIVLLDINMGPIDGFEITKLIRHYSPSSRIIALSMFVLPAYAKKMKALGAMGYVTKGSHADEIIKSITEVSQGNFYYCQQIEKVMKTETKMYGKRRPEVHLTQREIEIISLIKSGLSSNEIAERLKLSPRTIHIHRSNIFRKLNVRNVSSMISAANELGL